MSTLSVGATSVTLPDSLMWSDEFQWAAQEQTVSRSVTGALIVRTALKLAGRPITLAAEDDSSGWVRRAVVLQIATWANTPGQILTLNMRGVTRNVIFRVSEQAFDARPVVAFEDVDADDFYHLTLRLMEI